MRTSGKRSEAGFGLVELLVVVLVIAVLLAVAVPVFIGARARAQDRAAQASLRNAVVAARPVFSDGEDYAGATAENNQALKASEPSLTFLDLDSDGSSGVTQVSAASMSVNGAERDNRLVASARSGTGRCWYIQDVAGPPGTLNSGATWAVGGEGDACAAVAAPEYDSPLWVRDLGDVQVP